MDLFKFLDGHNFTAAELGDRKYVTEKISNFVENAELDWDEQMVQKQYVEYLFYLESNLTNNNLGSALQFIEWMDSVEDGWNDNKDLLADALIAYANGVQNGFNY